MNHLAPLSCRALQPGLRLLLAVCGALCAFPLLAWAGKDGMRVEIIANADLTEEGRKIPRPTPGEPAYYVPVILGYQEAGKIVAGEEPPKRDQMLRHLAQALAKEGYVLQALRPDANKTMPSLIISIEWGYMNPDVVESGSLDLSTGEDGSMSPGALRSDPTQSTTTDFNQRNMITLVTGSAVSRQVGFSQQDWLKVRDAVAEGRYFIIVSAYDFAASLKGEQKLLWRARMSTERQGIWMNEAVPALVAAGAPLFGRQTEVPTFRPARLEGGTVTLAPLEFKGEGDQLPASPPEKKP